MANALLNFGAAGAAVLVLWLLMRAEFKSVSGRLDVSGLPTPPSVRGAAEIG